MSLKKVKQVRQDKGFKMWDILIYAVLAVVIIVLFIVFVFARPSSPITSISVLSGYGDGQRVVCTYNFITDALTADEDYISVEEHSGEAIRLLYTAEEGGYNIILIDRQNSSVSVTEADCPSLDCVPTAPITTNTSLPIICTTHRLIIRSDYVSGSVIQ